MVRGLLAHLTLEQELSVLHDLGDQGMAVDDGDLRAVLSLDRAGDDIEVFHILLEVALAEPLSHQPFRLFDVLLGDALQHLQLPVRVSAHHPQGGGCIDPPQPAGIRDRDPHHVLDDVPAAAHLDPVRELA